MASRLLRVVDATLPMPAQRRANGVKRGRPRKSQATAASATVARPVRPSRPTPHHVETTPAASEPETDQSGGGEVIERIPLAPDGRLLLTVKEAARRLAISRNTCYTLINQGAIASLTIGTLRRIPVAALDAYIAVGIAAYAAEHGQRGA